MRMGYIRQWEAKRGLRTGRGRALTVSVCVPRGVVLVRQTHRSHLFSRAVWTSPVRGRGRLQLLRHSSPGVSQRASRVSRRERGGGVFLEGLERSSCWSELQDASQKCDNMLLICIVLVHAHTSSAHSGQTVRGREGGREAAATWWDDSEWFFGDFFFFSSFFLIFITKTLKRCDARLLVQH